MCGIAGIYYYDQAPPDAGLAVETMAEAIAHRGKDEKGRYQNDHLALSHRRLSIIDLATGRQPMCNEDGTVVVACNGEIYNYRDLRQQLEGRGHIFTTSSDTEVLVHLFEDFGVDMLDRLNGIFAIALWDGRQKRLILARDHLGVKPLHIYQDKDRVLFGSEIKAILADQHVRPEIDVQAVHYFMNLRYVPGRNTLFHGVERLLPGEYAIIDKKGLHLGRYWKLGDFGTLHLTEAAAAAEIKSCLSQAVSRQLVADVPLGVYLSGGIDSTAVLAMTKRALPEKSITTYALGFNEPTDELDDAQRVAQYFRTSHHPFAIEPKPLQRLPEVLWYVEEPKINILQGYLLAQHAARFTKVALSGLGGDELFAGYLAYQYMKPTEAFHRWLPASLLRRATEALFRHPADGLGGTGTLAWDEYRRGGHLLLSLGDKCQYYSIIRNAWDYQPRMWSLLYGPRMLDRPLGRTRTVFEPYFRDRKRSFVEQALMAEFDTKLVDDFLLNEDRVSMAHGLEVRVPLLDRDLVAFATGLPVGMKMRGMTTKYIFRKAIQDMVPEFVLKKKKWGFTFNSYIQYRKDLKDAVQQVLTPAKVRDLGLFNYGFIQAVLRHPPHPRLRWHYFTLWMMVGFHIWHDMFISGFHRADPNRPKQIDTSPSR
jgi:asparagine synthase (glutamine-hydrolysing)